MTRILAAAAAIALFLVSAAVALANGPAFHFTEDVTGDTIVCDDTIYTALSGQIKIVVHEGAAANGNLNFTGTVVPDNVVLEDEAGNLYHARGAFWFGGTLNANQGTWQETFTGKLQIVGEGGTADSINVVFHVSPNGQVTAFDFGTCAEPA